MHVIETTSQTYIIMFVSNSIAVLFLKVQTQIKK